MKFRSILWLLALLVRCAQAEIASVDELRQRTLTPAEGRVVDDFSLSGTVTDVAGNRNGFILTDAKGARQFFTVATTNCPHAGDEVHLRGNFYSERSLESAAIVTDVSVLGHQTLPAPPDIPLGELNEQRDDLAVIRTCGTVVDATPDEVDPHCALLLLKDGPSTIPVSLLDTQSARKDLIDAQVRITGVYLKAVQGARKFSGPFVIAHEIELLKSPSADFFDAPALEPLIYRSPREVSAFGKRRTTGIVLATWGEDRLMIREPSGRIVNVTLSQPEELPRCGMSVVAAGYPETDLFRINLSKARCRTTDESVAADEMPTPVSAAEILTHQGHRRIHDTYHGQLIRLNGIVRSLPADGAAERRLILDSGEFRVPVDFSSCPRADDGLALGCTVEATGRCLLETDTWRADHVLPRLRGFTVVLRTADDIRVLTRPSWWTPARLLTAICLLFAALAAILVWNILLHRLAERRGRALFDAQIARAESELRVDERTRLAVELHDSISQNLTGASMRIDAARRCLDASREKTLRNLDVASRTLDSCRTELRNCIWDLRNQALEAKDMNEAIRTVLLPHVGDADLTIRFNIPRERLTDNTAHALMRIVRELAVNAVRHGSSKSIRIAGALEGGKLLFSVSDDGRGFDPEIRPGIADGHFGLEGVMERIRHFNGKMKIESSPSRGTRIAVSLDLPEGKQGTDNG